MDIIMVILMLVIIAILLRINSKLPRRDLAQEAIDRYMNRIQQSKEGDEGV